VLHNRRVVLKICKSKEKRNPDIRNWLSDAASSSFTLTEWYLPKNNHTGLTRSRHLRVTHVNNGNGLEYPETYESLGAPYTDYAHHKVAAIIYTNFEDAFTV
jgi:hypothetical protein